MGVSSDGIMTLLSVRMSREIRAKESGGGSSTMVRMTVVMYTA